LVTEVTAVMKTIICSETLRVPTGPHLERTRVFPDRASGLIGRGALEVLKAWWEVRIGRNQGPSDVAEERRRPCRARWSHDFSTDRTLEKLGPKG
jgi:hypothetical protein